MHPSLPPTRAADETPPDDRTRDHERTGPYVPGDGRPAGVSIPGYVVIDEIGRGGMGVVLKALQVKADRTVAVKLMIAPHAGGTARERFDAEIKAAAQLQHPNIVQVFEVGEADGAPYFTLEYVPGGSLGRRLRQSLLAPRETAAVMATLARAMAYAHSKGVIHRDLKPANVLLTPAGEPKIADFGLARRSEVDSRMTQSGTILGTPGYMPPEQASGDPDAVTPLADVYALGATLYEMLTGRPPFTGSNLYDVLDQVRGADPLPPSALQPKVPRDLETICLKCLHKEPGRRYESAQALADELDRFLAGKPILARRIGVAERTARWCRRNKTATALIAVSVLTAAIATGSAVTIYRQHQEVVAGLHRHNAALFTFSSELPAIVASNPLSGATRNELIDLNVRVLESSQGKVGSGNDWVRQAIAVRRGELAIAGKDLDAAEGHFREARQIAEEVRGRERDERDKATGNLAQAVTKLADLALARAQAAARRGEPDAAGRHATAALALYREALDLRQGVVDRPQSTEIPPAQALADLGRAHLALATALRETHDLPTARRHAETACDAFAKARLELVGGSHKATTAERDHAMALFEVARVSIESAPEADARTAYANAVTAFQNLVLKAPNAGHRINLSVAAAAFGDELMIRWKRPAEAKTYYAISQEQNRAVAAPEELVQFQQLGLALGYYRLGLAALKDGQPAEAEKPFARCLEWRESRVRDLEEAGKTNKDSVLLTAKMDRMLAQARCGKVAEAGKTAEGLVKLCDSITPVTPAEREAVSRWRIIAACGFAISSDAVPASDPRRAQLRAKAIDAVRAAVASGYSVVAFLETDPDLDAVRNDPDFKEVVASVKGR